MYFTLTGVILILFLLWLFGYLEFFTGYTPDQIGMQSFDPPRYKWFGRVQDKWGMSPKDYFLENQIYAGDKLIPMLRNDKQFISAFNEDNLRIYYPSSMLTIESIKSHPRWQYTYNTIDDSPPMKAERTLLQNVGEDSNYNANKLMQNRYNDSYNEEIV
jgi:hypothetical protein